MNDSIEERHLQGIRGALSRMGHRDVILVGRWPEGAQFRCGECALNFSISRAFTKKYNSALMVYGEIEDKPRSENMLFKMAMSSCKITKQYPHMTRYVCTRLKVME